MKRHVDTAPQGRADPASVKTITDNTALREIANQFQNAPFLAVDTEFMRERTYYPQLCLVQISDVYADVCGDRGSPCCKYRRASCVL